MYPARLRPTCVPHHRYSRRQNNACHRGQAGSGRALGDIDPDGPVGVLTSEESSQTQLLTRRNNWRRPASVESFSARESICGTTRSTLFTLLENWGLCRGGRGRLAESSSEFIYSDALLLNDEATVGGEWINDGRGPEMLSVVDWLAELRWAGRPWGSMGPLWNLDKKCQASEPSEWELSGGMDSNCFHSVGSRSGFGSSCSFCKRMVGGCVGFIGATMIGGDVGGVEAGDGRDETEEPEDMEAESGLQESFRRQLRI